MHIGIIMDGNGRWASKKGMPRSYGHKVGVERVEECIRVASNCGIRALTFYAFSTENWKRPQPEIELLFQLLRHQVKKKSLELKEKNVRVRFIGSRDRLSPQMIKSINHIENLTVSCNGLCLNIAMDYGGRDEIVRIVKRVANDISVGKLKVDEVSETSLDLFSDLSHCGPPDLIIRTGGEKRLSNFLLWHSAYSELSFLDTMWPDFTSEKLFEQVNLFTKKIRKYGSLDVTDES